MLNFFRKIRKNLAAENKFGRYMRYAVGEVVLIMLGIFMALQLQNWNENRKQDAQFKTTLEQLYNSITFDTENLSGSIEGYERIVDVIDFLLYKSDSLRSHDLPYALYSIVNFNDRTVSSETVFHANNLNYNPDNKQQNEISKYVINFIDYDNTRFLEYNDAILDVFKKVGLHSPKLNKMNLNAGWVMTDSTYYSANDIDNYGELLRSDLFKSQLKTLRSNYLYAKAITRVFHGQGISILKMIKNYHPDVKILFQDVSIIGTSLDGFDEQGGTDMSMIETDMDKNIWELETYLKEGEVKFRCRASWAQNWGGSDFPRGEAFSHGSNIPVTEAGNYHIILNLSAKTYEFIKLEE